MTEAQNTVSASGRCVCGACVFVADLPVQKDGRVKADVCHCGMCRRWAGAPLMAVEPASAPRFEGSAPVSVYASSDWAERGFCKTCGTGLFWRMRDGSHLSMPAGLFDDQSVFDLKVEIFIDHKPAFYDFAGERPRMTEAEVVAAFTGGAEENS